MPIDQIRSQPCGGGTQDAALAVLSGTSRRRGLAGLWPFLGPAFVAGVAYIDPGNFATNIQAGAAFGPILLWVIVAANLMAMLLQTLSAKLGIATGANLAELCRRHYPRWLVWTMWTIMELVAMATDLAEFLGAALGFYLLFGMPLWIAGLATAAATFAILALERRGFRPLEAVIAGLVGMVALCYLVEMALVDVDWGQALFHATVPQFVPGNLAESALLATGILGATVMPHVIYLHSALTQGRIRVSDPEHKRRLVRFEVIDVVLAMGLAGFVNAALLITAWATFHQQGLVQDGRIEEAYRTLEHILGPVAKYAFGISLLAAGLSSSSVGTMAGQVIMQGFMDFHIPVWLRRVVTMAPALLVIVIGLDPTRTLVISQVVLSFGLPFAVFPLVRFTARRDIMGPLVNRRLTTVIASLVAAVIAGLNLFLLWQLTFGGG